MKKFSAGKTAAVVAVAGGAVLASVAPVMADVSAQSPSQSVVRIESPAKVISVGAAVEVDVTYVCAAGTRGNLSLSLTQRRLLGVATGSGYKAVDCTGGFATTKITVTATNRAFGWGPAYAKAELYSQLANAADEREIHVG
ncbi:hypothetical protein [Lentzea sp. NPDC003310]|uniref:hypothetical protein n=1 Tax=Lentzea sp. NPDC003310 TaxID=3154447 RepID=UPI0033BA3EBA